MKRSLIYSVAALSIAVSPVLAEAPKPFADFTFKRVKPPKKGSKNRINIQIAPKVVPVVKPAPSGSKPKAGGAPVYEWFWKDISPKLDESGPGRLSKAVLSLRNSGAVAAPRLQGMQAIAAAHGTDILIASIGTDISPAMVLAVISVESAGKADAVSSAGAAGLMQLMPATAERFGVVDRLDPKQSIKGGALHDASGIGQ